MARRKALEVIEFFKAIYYKGIDTKRFGHRSYSEWVACIQLQSASTSQVPSLNCVTEGKAVSALEVIEFFKAIYYKGIDNEKVWTQNIRLLAFGQAR